MSSGRRGRGQIVKGLLGHLRTLAFILRWEDSGRFFLQWSDYQKFQKGHSGCCVKKDWGAEARRMVYKQLESSKREMIVGGKEGERSDWILDVS